MKVVQVYLPTYVTQTVLYAGLSQPLLRYYERLIAVHLAPVLYKDIARSGWDKFKERFKRGIAYGLKDMGYHEAYATAIAAAIALLAAAYKAKTGKDPGWYKGIMSYLKRYILGARESVEFLREDDFDRESKSNKLFTQVQFGKELVVQFISVPLTLKDLHQLFKADKQEIHKIVKSKAFAALANLSITEKLDIKALVFTQSCVICSIEEVEDIKQSLGNKEVSMIVVDTVNEVVITKLYIYGKVFRYSAPLKQIVRLPTDTNVTLDRLASMLKGIKLGSTL
jgi:hypothetical protein